MPIDPKHPLRIPTSKWLEKLKYGREFKRDHFDRYADEGMHFYTGYKPHDLWNKYMVDGDVDGEVPGPMADAMLPKMAYRFVNARVAELVQIYGPMLYHRNPVRTVTPRNRFECPPELYDAMLPPVPPLDPQMMQQAQMMGMDPQMLQQQHQQQVQQRQQQVQQMHQEAQQVQGRATTLAKAKGKLMEDYLNYTPNELDLKKHSRQAIDEALIKGRGILWCELKRPYPGGPAVVGSFYDSIDNLVIDPDADEWEGCQWIARKHCEPVWKVAKDHGLKEDFLRKHAKVGRRSMNGEAERDVEREHNLDDDTESETTNDNIEYWEIYSRMGMGDRLAGIPEEYRGVLEDFGDNVYLVVSKGIKFPLNLPERLLIAASEGDEAAFEEAFERVQWPIPYWIDNQWPCTPLDFHFIPNNPWPLAHIRPGLPELKYSNWVMSWLAEQAQNTSRLFMGYLASLDDETKQAIKHGGGFTPLSLNTMDGKKIEEILSFITPPKGTSADLLSINEKAQNDFDKRTGLAEAMYAAPGGSRSATESQMKQEALNIRPDDMANKVEDWMSEVARKEALAAQWLLDTEDVEFILGPKGAELWEQLIMSAEPASMALEFDYRIEAGTARKPNKAQKIENMQQALQTVLPIAMQYSQLSGDVGTVNALLSDWAKANDIQEIERYLLKPPDPQVAQKQQQMQDEQHQMEKQKLQLEAMKLQSEMQGKGMDAQLKQLDMVLKQMEMQFKQQEAEMDLAIKQQEMAMDQQQHEQELAQDQQVHAQEMAQEQQKSQLQLQLESMMGSRKIQLAEKQGEQQLDMAEKQGQQKIQTMKQQARARPKTKQGA